MSKPNEVTPESRPNDLDPASAVGGGTEFRVHRAGPPGDAADLGAWAAADLLAQGAARLLGPR